MTTAEAVAWLKSAFNRLPHNGILAYPRSGLVYRKTGLTTLELVRILEPLEAELRDSTIEYRQIDRPATIVTAKKFGVTVIDTFDDANIERMVYQQYASTMVNMKSGELTPPTGASS